MRVVSVLPWKNHSQLKEGKAVHSFEDFQTGERIELGSVTVTQEEIIAYAKQDDSQPLHISPVQAKHSYYADLSASG